MFGSISTGTMRPQDLIPAFIDALRDFEPAASAAYESGIPDTAWDDDDDDYWQSDDAAWVLDQLFDDLSGYAPVYGYFGSHEGDGADYGFWLSHDAIDDAVRDGEALKVSDTVDVPDDYFGEVFHVNDHGNITLYVKDNEESDSLREIWAVV